jgi:FkbM family methyltransferase
MLKLIKRATLSARRATFPARKWLANTIYTPPSLPPEMSNISFSSWGEDVIAASWLRAAGLNFSDIRYLDIGAAEPKRLSNTYLLYTFGAKGVLIEPDPDQADALGAARPRDAVINAGVAFDHRRRAPLVRMQRRVFNTFLDRQVEATVAASAEWEDNQQNIVDRLEVDLIPINEVIARYLGDVAPHFLSIDTEGCDFDILMSLDLERFKPTLICVEAARPVHEFERILEPHSYRRICQTPDNLMFIR